MNLILLFKEDFIDSRKRVHLDGRRKNHIVNIQNGSVGDELRVGILGGKIGTGLITEINTDNIEMDVCLLHDPPLPLPLTLILALPRPRVLKRILSVVSSLGVKKIILINSFRVEKSFWLSPLLHDEHYRQYLIAGLEQARDTVLSEVLTRQFFKPFVEDELPDIVKDTTAIVAHPTSKELCPCNVTGQITLVVGPEGGFIPYEIEKLRDCGFLDVNLGERILSVETAVPVLLSKLF